jgi:hypothetical protein
MFDACYVQILILNECRRLADVPDRLNGRQGLRQSFEEPPDELAHHSSSFATSVHNTSQVLDEIAHSEVRVGRHLA